MVDTDTGYAPETWAFDEEVTRVFDDMLGRSIPNYEGMRDITNRLISQCIMEHGNSSPCVILDIGSSRGETIERIVERNDAIPCTPTKDCLAHSIAPLDIYGLEISKPMVTASRERFAGRTDVKILECDLSEGIQDRRAHV